MSQNFIESKEPIFISLSRIIENHKTDLDFDLFIEKFQENFEKEQEDDFLIFWNKQGEERVLESWNDKYKLYLEQVQDNGIEENPKSQKESQVSELSVLKANSDDLMSQEQNWKDLWQEHREEIYHELYLIFTTIYCNYFLDWKKNCQTPQSISEDLEETEEGEENNSDLHFDTIQLRQDLEQLKILGLPTSFIGRQQYSSKNNKTCKKSFIHYSDFFSDSEMENESSESDMEDYGHLEINKNKKTVHKVQQKPVSKVKNRKRNRKLKNVPSYILEEKGLLKYWRKRFSLFSRFDEGIRLDRESWFSVTPEKVAKHLAERLKCSIIVDGFCGSGGNVIQFASTCDKVIAIDIDPVKLEMAKHNAKIYKVSHKIEFILGDFLQLATAGKLKADILFLSPPWGGPKYKNKKQFDIEKYLLPVKASELMEASRKVSQNIALFLPRNSCLKQVVKLAGIGNRCEIEHNYLDSRLVAITALYGEEVLSRNTTN